MSKILMIGPDPEKSCGGMATVINGLRNDAALHKRYDIAFHSSYVDGSRLKVMLYSLWKWIVFCLRKKDFDVVHLHVASYGSTFRKAMYAKVAQRCGKKVVLHIHGGKYLTFYENLSSGNKRRAEEFLRSADLVLVLSEGWKQQFEAVLKLKNCQVLKNGVDHLYLSTATGGADTEKSFLFLGRLCEKKGVYDLLYALEKAVKSEPEIRCYLAGDGELDKVQSLISELSLEDNVEVKGWISGEEKLALLHRVSVLVLPSYYEGLPMAILEGMASGKALVTSTVGAIPEVVSEENGILIEPGDRDALESALLRCCREPIWVQQAGMKNLEKAEKLFSEKAMHEKLADYYDQVLGASL